MTKAGQQDELIDSNLLLSAGVVRALGVGKALTDHIAALESNLVRKERGAAATLIANDGIDTSTLLAALTVKAAIGQINVVVHVLGILVSLPYLLDEGEVIERLSLGAGNTGRSHDLETDRRVAEFKFITWRGGSESIRQNSLFIDLFNLVSSETTKRREMYVLGTQEALRFLNGGRAIQSVLSRNDAARKRFDQRHAADGFVTVSQYWATVRNHVDLIDLREKVPAFNANATALLAVGDDVT
jgi:hypothetical protein